MSLTQAWKHALSTFTGSSDLAGQPRNAGNTHVHNGDGFLHSTRAWSTLSKHITPTQPGQCRYYAHDSATFSLNDDARGALQYLLELDRHSSSSSKLGLETPSPVLIALCSEYIDSCHASFDAVYSDLANGIDPLQTILISVSSWFHVWLSPFAPGAIFEHLQDGAELLLWMQSRLRSLIDRRLVEALRFQLQLLITSSLADGTSAAHPALGTLESVGLTSVALSLLTDVVNNEISRKVRAVVDVQDVQDQDEVLSTEEAARPVLKRWLDDEIKPRYSAIREICTMEAMLDTIHSGIDRDEISDEATWESRLDFQLDKTLCFTRAEQLFDLVALYPDSIGGLEDLKASLASTGERVMVSSRLLASLRSRLLHPGAHTRDIIQMYVHMVRALRSVDASGIVLSRVVSPLRRYLRARKDTVPVIVSSMLGDDPNFTLLKDELEQADEAERAADEQAAAATHSTGGAAGSRRRRRPRRSLQARKTRKAANGRGSGGALSDSDSSDEDWGDPDWVPKPVEAGRAYRQTRSKDIITMLISIFDDRSGFISALEKSMADQLIKVRGYRAMNEYRNNMVLKKRFGERNMGRCDVMLGDVTDSRRIDAEVHSRLVKEHQKQQAQPKHIDQQQAQEEAAVRGMVNKLHPLIVSRQFWPDIVTTAASDTPAGGGGSSVSASNGVAGTAGTGPSQFTLPAMFRSALDRYGSSYRQTKAMRRLEWLPQLGSLEMEVELDSGESVAVDCTLLQASVLELISRVEPVPPSQDRIVTLTAVMDHLNLQLEKDARDSLQFWAHVGILDPLPIQDTFAVRSSLPIEASST
ncbi:hypothetical protein BCV70DRAFT_187766 [Testicularia cyperi]|uniref:Cullin family profile domain-containing protein n=1 Tax=Testicularia cyperi TaxID=1882483 RepID=A0A317XUA8_9BASI|nr:hypothetical protein BCV70DRAFT_187766 [Testicularia cyperi]